jgi:hypothetical protein
MSRRWDLIRRPLCVAGLATAALLGVTASAMGQAAVDQYIPSANPGSQHGSAANAVQQARQSTTPGARSDQGKAKRENLGPVANSKGPGGTSDSGGGGYPLTAFVIIVALLFVAGVAARYLPGMIRRWRPRQVSRS